MDAISSDLSSLSQALVELVGSASAGVVAVKAAAYRTTSGVVLGGNLIAAANHAVKRDSGIPLETGSGAQATANVIGREPGLDLAILRSDDLPLQPLPSRDPASVKAGDLVSIVGMTTDAGASASLGIMGAVGGSRRIWRGGTLDHFFRLDVNLYPSQSGAAVVGADGALIGMATPALLRHSAVAVPLTTLNRVADELVRQGRIRRGYVGVGLQPVSIPASLREKLALNHEGGLIVLSVEPESPAEKAGWQLGDILVAMNGTPMVDVDELQAVLRGDSVGRRASALLIRGGEKIESEITIEERASKER
ncbi:MAG: S1C family serine protease [Bryobacteraceae bacterium]